MNVSDFYCECMKCRGDKELECEHEPWKNKREELMKPNRKMAISSNKNDETINVDANKADSNSESECN